MLETEGCGNIAARVTMIHSQEDHAFITIGIGSSAGGGRDARLVTITDNEALLSLSRNRVD